MEKEYILQGLRCANCARKIEEEIKLLPYIRSTSLNLVTSLLRVEMDPSVKSDVTSDINKIICKYESDVIATPKTSKKEEHEGEEHSNLTKIICGALFFLLAIGLSHFVSLPILAELFLFLTSYLILGGGVILKAVKNALSGDLFDENFLMGIATIGAFLIGDFAEAVAVMLFFQVGEYFEDLAIDKSKKSISNLMDIRPDFANLKKGDAFLKVSPEDVKIGDMIMVKPGEKVPLDGVVIQGESMLDTRSLTGESMPMNVSVGETILSGCINQNGVLTIEVIRTFGESTVSKIIDLVENASNKKAETENFITSFSKYYTPTVCFLALILAILPPLLFHMAWSICIHRALIFLVISCPCALVISIPLSFFGGIGAASKKGILIKGSNYLEALNHLDTIVFDKTGTLTKGVFEVTKIEAYGQYHAEQVLEFAAFAEVYSTHPIALSIQKKYNKEIPKDAIRDVKEISGNGVCATIHGKPVLVGSDKLMKTMNVSFMESSEVGTQIYVALDHELIGMLLISDEVKKESKEAIKVLKQKGIRRIIMLTGDREVVAKRIGNELGIDEVYSELLPQEKVEKVEWLEKGKPEKSKIAFVGDGINDAPTLARADIGFAMGGIGSDAAIEASDIVLMTDEISKLIEALEVAKFTKRIVWQNIFFSLSVKIGFLALGAFGIANMWQAVFADVGVSVLAICNAMRIMKIK